jgi:hypothetical protein
VIKNVIVLTYCCAITTILTLISVMSRYCFKFLTGLSVFACAVVHMYCCAVMKIIVVMFIYCFRFLDMLMCCACWAVEVFIVFISLCFYEHNGFHKNVSTF